MTPTLHLHAPLLGATELGSQEYYQSPNLQRRPGELAGLNLWFLWCAGEASNPPHTPTQTNRQTNKPTTKQASKQPSKQTDKQANTHTHTQTVSTKPERPTHTCRKPSCYESSWDPCKEAFGEPLTLIRKASNPQAINPTRLLVTV